MARLSEKAIIESLDSTGGIVSESARLLGVSRTTLNNRIKVSDKLKSAKESSRSILIDEAKSGLRKLVLQGDFRAIRYTLRVLAGWNETQAIDVNISKVEPVANFAQWASDEGLDFKTIAPDPKLIITTEGQQPAAIETEFEEIEPVPEPTERQPETAPAVLRIQRG